MTGVVVIIPVNYSYGWMVKIASEEFCHECQYKSQSMLLISNCIYGSGSG